MPFRKWCLIFFIITLNLFAQDTIKIESNHTFTYLETYSFVIPKSGGKNLSFWEAKKILDTIKIRNVDLKAFAENDTVWAKFNLKNNTPYSLFFGSDLFTPYYEIYYLVNDKYEKQVSGLKVDIGKKVLKHANMLVSLPFSAQETYYLKFVLNQPKIQFFVVSYPIVINLQLTNNYFQGGLIGILILAICFCGFFYNRMKVMSYLYFTLFLSSFLIYTLVDFDILLKYLWFFDFGIKGYESVYNLPYSFTTIFLILFIRDYFKENEINNIPDWIFYAGIIIKIVLEIMGFTIWPIAKECITDTLIIGVYTTIICYIFFSNMNKIKLSFFVGFIVIFLGFFFHSNGVFTNYLVKNYTFFAIYNYIIALGICIFSLNIAEQLKLFKDNMYEAQNNLIVQLKENAALNDKINTELERLVDERTKQLDAFVYRASHDIKGPLRSILGITNIGLDEAKEPSVNLLFQHINKTTLRLDNTLNDLLDVIRINNKNSELENIDFQLIIDKIKSNFEHIKEYKTIQIVTEIDTKINFKAETANVSSLLQNLIENGLKYQNPRNQNKKLSIKIHQDNQNIYIVVEDNGMGISPEQKDKIFQMFYKIHPESNGSGLGLYIAKLSVDKLNGTIELTSEVGVGSTFKVSIPKQI
ncbi:MAG: ATP-binding protein [Bacteroidota bacterium]|nr:ATP-binding protein [Bacteroidota bacterium]